jgi:hypothetical protein
MTKAEFNEATKDYPDNAELTMATYDAFGECEFREVMKIGHGFKPSNVITLEPGEVISG